MRAEFHGRRHFFEIHFDDGKVWRLSIDGIAIPSELTTSADLIFTTISWCNRNPDETEEWLTEMRANAGREAGSRLPPWLQSVRALRPITCYRAARVLLRLFAARS